MMSNYFVSESEFFRGRWGESKPTCVDSSPCIFLLKNIAFLDPSRQTVVSIGSTASIVEIDLGQWQENNIMNGKCNLPKTSLSHLLDIIAKKRSEYLIEQQTVLRPVIKLFKTHKVVIIGDREFHSVDLAQWIHRQGVKFVLRQKKDTSFRQKRQKFKS